MFNTLVFVFFLKKKLSGKDIKNKQTNKQMRKLKGNYANESWLVQ